MQKMYTSEMIMQLVTHGHKGKGVAYSYNYMYTNSFLHGSIMYSFNHSFVKIYMYQCDVFQLLSDVRIWNIFLHSFQTFSTIHTNTYI